MSSGRTLSSDHVFGAKYKMCRGKRSSNFGNKIASGELKAFAMRKGVLQRKRFAKKSLGFGVLQMESRHDCITKLSLQVCRAKRRGLSVFGEMWVCGNSYGFRNDRRGAKSG